VLECSFAKKFSNDEIQFCRRRERNARVKAVATDES